MITFRLRDHHFGRDQLDKAIAKSRRSNLIRAGAFVRTAARRSIRPAPKPPRANPKQRRAKGRRRNVSSRPGQPPRQHTAAGQNLKLILFAWEEARKSVVVGPVLFKSSAGVRITEVLEHGGRSYTRPNPRAKSRKRATRVAARPFMRPALASEAPKFPNLFANSVK